MSTLRHVTVRASRVLVLAAMFAMGPFFLLAGLESGSTAIAQSPGCVTRPGATLGASARLRVFSAEAPEGAQEVFVCVKSSGKTRGLGVRSAIVRRPIALSGLWAAGTEERGKPQDELLRDVIARNGADGARNLCRIGIANRPGQLVTVTSLVVDSNGDIGWSGQEKLNGAQPVVGACVSGVGQILAQGSGLNLRSLRLSGDNLTWSNEGRRESFRLSQG